MATYKVESVGRQVFVSAQTAKVAEMIGVTFILLGWGHEWDRLAYKTNLGPTVTLATFDDVQSMQTIAKVRVITNKDIEALGQAVRARKDADDARSCIIGPLLYDPRS